MNKTALVVAAAQNNAIGYKGQLPWRLRDDLALFKQTTLGHPVVMGRKTMDALQKPLPGRTNIVITRGATVLPGFLLASNLAIAMDMARQAPGAELICVIGGGEIYTQAMPMADAIYISRVEASPTEADAFFPEIPQEDWQLETQVSYPANDKNEFAFQFQIWQRV